MRDTGHPVCDYIRHLLSQGMSPDAALSATEKIEPTITTAMVSESIRRERQRIKKKIQRAKKTGSVQGTVLLDIDSSLFDSESEKKEEQTPSIRDKSDWPPDYREQFWLNVPAGRKVEKKAAMASLDRVKKSGVSWAKFFRGVLRWNASMRGKETRFIKHPTTWLNKGCWEDEVSNDARTGENRQGNHSGIDPIAAAAARRFGGGNGPMARSTSENAHSNEGRRADANGTGGGGSSSIDADYRVIR